MNNKTILVRESYLNDVTKTLKHLSVKAERFGTPLDIQINPYPEAVKISVYNTKGKRIPRADFFVDARRVTISYEIIRANGWTPVALIEALPRTDRRVITILCDQVVTRPEWYSSDMRCDHCGTGRYRKKVIILHHTDGREVQVGTSCLKDFCGIDPASLILWAEVLPEMWLCEGRDCSIDEMEGYVSSGHTYWECDHVLALACDMVNKHGYTKSSEKNSTKERVVKALLHGDIPTPEADEKAKDIMSWLLNGRHSGELEQNCQAIADSGYCSSRHIGYLSYMPVAYDRMMARREATRAAGARSSHVGNVGDRIEVKIISKTIVSSYEGDYGVSYLWKLTDDKGNIYIWRTNKGRFDLEDKDYLKGTVKGHTEFDGVLQTELTRCRLSA